MLVGAYTTQGEGVSKASRHEWVKEASAVVHALAALRDAQCAPLHYLAINFNQNVALQAHRDKNNWGPSWLFGCGTYSGGQLWVEAVGEEVTEAVHELVPLPADLAGDAPPGLLGRLYDIKGKWLVFSGQRWHAVFPSSGSRVSVTLFTPRSLHRLQEPHWRLLHDLGFIVPPLLRLVLEGQDQVLVQHPLQQEKASRLQALLQELEKGVREKSPSRPIPVMLRLVAERDVPSDFWHFVRRCKQLCLDDHARRLPRTMSSSTLFPWGVPFMQEFLDLSVPPASRRRHLRWKKEQLARQWCNWLVLFCGWHRLGMPDVEAGADQCAWAASPAQFSMGQECFAMVRAWCRSEGPLPSDGGLPHLARLLSQAGGSVEEGKAVMSYETSATGLPWSHEHVKAGLAAPTVCLCPGRVSLPQVAGTIPLQVPTVPRSVQVILQQPGSFMRKPAPPSIPRSFSSMSSWPGMADELLSKGLCKLMPPEIGEFFNGERVSAGLFGVPKKSSDKCRLIIDRRPQNGRELSLRDVVLRLVLDGSLSATEGVHLLDLMTLPFFGQFSRLMTTQQSSLMITGEDASDYYYHLRLPEAIVKTNAVGPVILHEALADSLALQVAVQEYGPRKLWSLHAVAPPMGDIKSPDIAQLVHSHVALEHAAIRPEEWLRYGHPVPLGPIWAGCYVDDFGQVTVIEPRLQGALDPHHVCTRSKHAHDALLQAYQVTGIQRKDEKAIKKAPEAAVWGASLSSSSHLVQSSPMKRRLLVWTTLSLIRSSRAKPAHVQMLVGHWLHQLLPRRYLMCLLSKTFVWLRVMKSRWAMVQIPRKVKEELAGLCLFAPLMHQDTTSPVARWVVASDATLHRGAAVIAPLSPEEALMLWVKSDRKALSMEFVPGVIDEDMYMIKHIFQDDPVLSQLVATLPFKVVSSFGFKDVNHVNKQELLAWRTGLFAALKRHLIQGSRAVSLLDSAVVVNALRKGRSSSHRLNPIFRSVLGDLAFSQVTPCASVDWDKGESS